MKGNLLGLLFLEIALVINCAPVAIPPPVIVYVAPDPFPIARSFGCDELARTCRAAERSAKISKGVKL